MPRYINKIVVHHTGASRKQTVESIQQYWRDAHPTWAGRPGYHILIRADGSAVRLAPDEKITFGVANHNAYALHVCCIGGVNGHDERTDAQKATLLKRLQYWKQQHPHAIILGHRDLSPDLNKDGIIEPTEWVKLCPGFNAKDEYAHLTS